MKKEQKIKPKDSKRNKRERKRDKIDKIEEKSEIDQKTHSRIEK